MDGKGAAAPGKEAASIKAIWAAQWRCRSPASGQCLTACLPFAIRGVTPSVMVLLALALATAIPAGGQLPPKQPSRAIQHATASVRILPGERVSADRLPETAIITDTTVRGA